MTFFLHIEKFAGFAKVVENPGKVVDFFFVIKRAGTLVVMLMLISWC